MPIDAGLLRQAKAAESRVIDAEHSTEVARADFHRAVRRLQLDGASLREIAAALGLSHQRVHQIVETAGGTRRWRKGGGRTPGPFICSFCCRPHPTPEKLVAGPGVYICETCVTTAAGLVSTGSAATAPAAAIELVAEQARAERCSFCGKRRHQVPAMASAAGPRICAECLSLCQEILAESLT
jgi:ClpX C4-type zinc finger